MAFDPESTESLESLVYVGGSKRNKFAIPSASPLFISALSGELRFPTGQERSGTFGEGPEKNAITLGELLEQTFEYGQLNRDLKPNPYYTDQHGRPLSHGEEPSVLGGMAFRLDHRPAWPPDLVASVLPHQVGPYAHMARLLLRRDEIKDHGPDLTIADVKVEGDRRRFLLLATPGDSQEQLIPLESGANLDRARSAVTDAARALIAQVR